MLWCVSVVIVWCSAEDSAEDRRDEGREVMVAVEE